MSEQNNSDEILKDLVGKIQQFFAHQIETNSSLSEASRESLTVATECIEQAYAIQRRPASRELIDIFNLHKQQQSSNQGSTGNPQDATQLLTNLASTLFTQAGGGLLRGAATNLAAAAAAMPNDGQQQQQQQTTTASSTQSAPPTDEAPSSQPRHRRNVTEAEKMAAESFKNQGNDSMKADQLKEAYDYYSQAIAIDNNNAIYYSNRAAASSKLGDHQAAVNDCKEAIEIDANYSKAYGRLGLAYASLENHLEAKNAYVKAVELDPTNESYQNNLRIAEEKLASSANNTAGAGARGSGLDGIIRSAMSNPQLVSMAMRTMQDPGIQNMLSALTNPNGRQPPTAGQQQSATSAPASQQASNQQQQSNAGTDAATTPGGQQQQQQPPLNPADLLSGSAHLAGNDILGASQQLLTSINLNNPALMDNMRRMMGQIFTNPGQGGQNQGDRNPPPGYS